MLAECVTIPIVVFRLKVPQSERPKIKAARFRDTEFLSPSFRYLWCCSHEEVMNQRVLCCSSLLPDQHWKSKRHGESEVGHKSEQGGNSILASKQIHTDDRNFPLFHLHLSVRLFHTSLPFSLRGEALTLFHKVFPEK